MILITNLNWTILLTLIEPDYKGSILFMKVLQKLRILYFFVHTSVLSPAFTLLPLRENKNIQLNHFANIREQEVILQFAHCS